MVPFVRGPGEGHQLGLIGADIVNAGERIPEIPWTRRRARIHKKIHPELGSSRRAPVLDGNRHCELSLASFQGQIGDRQIGLSVRQHRHFYL